MNWIPKDWGVRFLLGASSFALVEWTYIFYLNGLFDLRLAITLVVVEVPITGVISSIIANALHERSQLSTEAKLQRAKQYRSYLKEHYERELIPAMQTWGQPRAAPIQFGGLVETSTFGTPMHFSHAQREGHARPQAD